MPMKPRPDSERGASALLVALGLLLLMGVAAIAIDVGAGFNERRQDQTSADMAVMSGALEASFLTSDNQAVAQMVVILAEPNLTTTFALPDYQTIWRNCTDTGRTPDFIPLPDPWGGGGTVDCISRSSSFLRVRVPDQLVPTSFGRVLGVNSLQTHAIAVAIVSPGEQNAPVVPYGISGGAGTGELCFGSAPGGTAFPPCNGPSAGTFGTLLSEFFGDFYGSVDCGNPGQTEIESGTALGIDHFVGLWPNPGGAVSPGDSHPGDGAVLAMADINRDSCDDVGGVAVATDSVPLNTMRVDSGFPSNAMEAGLVSNNFFFGEKSRLQQPGLHPSGGGSAPNSTRIVVGRRQGANEVLWPLDNHGPWDYLNGSGPGACLPAQFTGAMDELQKAAQFNVCLAAYGSSGPVMFDPLIGDSPRFAWAPQYWYDLPTTGLSWEPIMSFRMVFIGGTYFNCSGSSCDVVFYPDQDQTSELCDPGGGASCQTLSLDQFSAWVLPTTAIPDEVKNAFPGGSTPFAPELYR
ncbi:MAG: hypothetical protein ACT4OP_07300 [Actinomycetota bacterium]